MTPTGQATGTGRTDRPGVEAAERHLPLFLRRRPLFPLQSRLRFCCRIAAVLSLQKRQCVFDMRLIPIPSTSSSGGRQRPYKGVFVQGRIVHHRCYRCGGKHGVLFGEAEDDKLGGRSANLALRRTTQDPSRPRGRRANSFLMICK